jgi:uncharacterized membrane protein YfcA
MKSSILGAIALLLLGFGAGFLNGLLGAGGGILLVYGLRRVLRGRTDPRAIYASAIAVMLPLSALSAMQYVQNGHLDTDLAALLALPALLGGAVGALLLRRLSTRTLARLFSAVVLVSGVILVL